MFWQLGVVSSSLGRGIADMADLSVVNGVATASYTALSSELNKPPYIEDVVITADPDYYTGAVLTATVVGSVNGPFTVGTHIYKWYVLDSAQGAIPQEILGATSSTFTLTIDQQGKYVVCAAKFVQVGGVNNMSDWFYSSMTPVITENIAPVEDIVHAWEDYFNIETGESIPANWGDPVNSLLINLGTGNDYEALAATKPAFSVDELIFVSANSTQVEAPSANVTHPPVFEFWVKGRFTSSGTIVAMGNTPVLGMDTSGQFISAGTGVGGDTLDHVFRVVLSGADSILQIDNGAEITFTETTAFATRLSLGAKTSGGDPVGFELKTFQKTADGTKLTAQEVADKWAYHGF